MNRTPQACHQCGREIYFDGLCVQCQAENERNEILAYSQQEIEAKIDEICEERITLSPSLESGGFIVILPNSSTFININIFAG